MSGEAVSPAKFVCTGAFSPKFLTATTGTLKAIVFKTKGKSVSIEDATRVGYQIHFFGPNSNTIKFVTEAPLRGIAITQDTFEEVLKIHGHCVDFCDHQQPSPQCPPLYTLLHTDPNVKAGLSPQARYGNGTQIACDYAQMLYRTPQHGRQRRGSVSLKH
jgi:hypothetical protein